jgi:hypothetical protein
MMNTLKKIAGRDAELTIRGERSFTISFEDQDIRAAQKINEFFKDQAKVEIVIDEECGIFVYIDC